MTNYTVTIDKLDDRYIAVLKENDDTGYHWRGYAICLSHADALYEAEGFCIKHDAELTDNT